MNKTLKNILIVAVIVLVGDGVYLYFSNQSAPTSGSLQSSSGAPAPLASSSDNQIAQDTSFLSTLLNLNTIRIDTTLFASTSFKSLRDNTVEIVNDGIVGRPNPFAPFDQGPGDTETTLPPIVKSVPTTR